jgi:tagatose-6-phosphate ketose/aldose isomerase
LLALPLAEQQERGYADTVREILQQPATWLDTADLLRQPQVLEQLQAALTPRPSHIVLTGSGSSMYIGECLAPSLQLGLGIPAQAIAAGTLLTHWRSVLPPGAGLLISLARSGDSPESCGVVRSPVGRCSRLSPSGHTCNANGKLATTIEMIRG